ncbi:efflux RND transporter permease subunit [Shigella flexneri]
MIALSSINKAVVFHQLLRWLNWVPRRVLIWSCWTTVNMGHEKLTEHERAVISWQRDRLSGSPGYAERPGKYLDVQSERDAAKAEAMGVALSDINQTISTAFGSRWRERLPRPGAGEKSVCPGRHTVRVCCRITSTNGMYNTWHNGALCLSSTEWTYGSPQLEALNGIPSMEILGEAAAREGSR